jgi:hypothetical protein
MIVCKVCGRPPGYLDSLCFGVHANCSDRVQVDREAEIILFRVHDTERPENVWYCVKDGMRVVEGAELSQWKDFIALIQKGHPT